MSYISFEKEKLINLGFSLNRELVRANSLGTFASTSIVCCNTRKYHGLLVCPIDDFNEDKHVLLSTLDETILQHGSSFNLGIHYFKGDIYEPGGHKYLRKFEMDPIPKLTYRVGGVILTKELMLDSEDEQLMIRYTLEDAHSPTTLRLRPFLAFRNMHHLTHANSYANTRTTPVDKGVKAQLYEGFPHLHMQISKSNEFIANPDWYYNIEYIRERERGYDCHEDLFTPGYFEMSIKKGENIIFSASLKEVSSAGLKKKFAAEVSKRPELNSLEDCLKNAAKQFFVFRKDKAEVIAGFPWFGSWGRDTFISLPGLTLSVGDVKSFESVADTMINKMKGGLFPNIEGGSNYELNSVDAPFWFLWALQEYYHHTGMKAEEFWKKYSKPIKTIFNGLEKGLAYNIKMQDNGLIYAGQEGKALTWMDAVVYGTPVTPRIGCPVEINALWYNGLMFSLAIAGEAKDKTFISKWKKVSELVKKSFNDLFWNAKKGYLADVVTETDKDWSVRPNQVFATSLEYSPLSTEQKKSVLDMVKNKLLTPRGLRTLSPNDDRYIGIYEGGQEQRDHAYHQGTVWPWLLGHFCEGYLKVHKNTGVATVKNILAGFEECVTEHGISTISEIYDGNPPHYARGTISQAWSVSELLRVMHLLKKHEQ